MQANTRDVLNAKLKAAGLARSTFYDCKSRFPDLTEDQLINLPRGVRGGPDGRKEAYEDTLAYAKAQGLIKNRSEEPLLQTMRRNQRKGLPDKLAILAKPQVTQKHHAALVAQARAVGANADFVHELMMNPTFGSYLMALLRYAHVLAPKQVHTVFMAMARLVDVEK